MFEFDSSHCTQNDREMKQNSFQLGPSSNDVSVFTGRINDQICAMQLNHDETNKVYKICLELVEKTQQLNEIFMKKENGMDSLEAVKMSTVVVREELLQCATRYKRDKQIATNKFFVAPEEKTVGVRWISTKLKNSLTSVPKCIPNVYQRISVIKSICSLFERKDFHDEYFKYNEEQVKSISDGIYTNFRSGNNFKTNELFSRYPNSLQIEIAQDDFEPCNALGSKSTLYKLSPVYVSIKNIPPKFSSKLSNILLASLCHTDDLKSKYADWNDIWLDLVSELRQIENGIVLNDGTVIKGTVVSVVSDNLGANIILGLVKNFSKTKYPCRFCLCSLEEIQTKCKEIASKRRTKAHYEDQLKKNENTTKVDLKDTFGVAMHCALNDLKFYHMLDSTTPDIMHDINEGAIPFLLKNLFEYLFKHKVCTEYDLKNKIKFHDFGLLQKKNVSSELSMTKSCLGQNASQIVCLFQSIPFILYGYKNNEIVKEIWICVEALLKITQIVYSEKIDKNDLSDLEKFVEIHLQSFITIFDECLKFKQHSMTHLVSTIIAMGPVKWFSMKRYEAKHKEIKGYIGDSNNFRNITKTIAERHQQMISIKENIYIDHFGHAKVMKLIDSDFMSYHKEILQADLKFNDENSEKVVEIKWMNYNSFRYAKGFFIHFLGALYRIEKLLLFDNEYYFWCVRFCVLKHCHFLNSIKIKIFEPNLFKVIKFTSLENNNVYESKVLSNENYIILNTLDLKLLCK